MALAVLHEVGNWHQAADFRAAAFRQLSEALADLTEHHTRRPPPRTSALLGADASPFSEFTA